jgi:hypothetical protein
MPGNRLVIHKLHYQLDGWLGDDLLESDSCYVITDRLAKALQGRGLSGYDLKDVEVSVSDQFNDCYPGRELPGFVWLDITGAAGVSDFGVGSDGRLIVSESALEALKHTQLDNCSVSEFSLVKE